LFGQEWSRHQPDIGHRDADDSSALQQDSWQDWHAFAARNRFMGDTSGDGKKRGLVISGVSIHEAQAAAEEKLLP
jgi:hypothetical protein